MAFEPFYKSIAGYFRHLLPLTTYPLSTIGATVSNNIVFWWGGSDIQFEFLSQKNYIDPVFLGNMADDSWYDLLGFIILSQNGPTNEALCLQIGKTSNFYRLRCVRKNLTTQTIIISNIINRRLSLNNLQLENTFLLVQESPYNNRPMFKMTIASCGQNDGNIASRAYTMGASFYTDYRSDAFWGFLNSGESVGIFKIDDPNEQDGGDPDDEDKPGGNSGTGGGNGSYTIIKDNVPIPNMPTLTAGAAGFVTLYNPSAAILKLLADELNSDNVIQWIINYFEKPQDMVAGLGIVPVQPVTIGSHKPKLGSKSIDIAMPVIEDQFVEKDCGTLEIYKFYGSAFDYSPYSQIQIFLPYIGLKELNVDEVMGKTIGVKYHIDLFTGNCVAFVTVYNSGNEAVRYQFSGNCLQQIPINATSYDDAITNGIRLATMAVASIATAGAAGAAAGAAATEAGATAAEASTAAAVAESATAAEAGRELAGSTLSAIMTSKPHVERSGSLGGSIGLMSVQTPFIVRIIPRQSLPDNYKHYAGYPSNITATLSSLSGFTKMEKINLTGISATDDELAEIYKLLYSGVIL